MVKINIRFGMTSLSNYEVEAGTTSGDLSGCQDLRAILRCGDNIRVKTNGVEGDLTLVDGDNILIETKCSEKA